MNAAIDRRVVSPPSSERRVLHGAGLVVVHADTGMIKTQIDSPRTETSRRGGQVSVAFETRKYGESHRENVLGAVPEMLDDPTLSVVRNKLYTTDGLRSTPDLSFDNDGKPVQYSMAVVVFDESQDTPFNPYDSNEARSYKWMNPNELLDHRDVRPLARHAVSYLSDEGILKKKVEDFYDPEIALDYAIPEGFVIADYYKQRERVRDMEPGVAYTVQ